MSIETHNFIDSKTCTSATCSNVTGIAHPVAVMLVNVSCLRIHSKMSQMKYHGTLQKSYSLQFISV